MNANDENYGAEWLKKNGVELSDFGETIANLLNRLYVGIYHADDLIMKANWKSKWRIEVTLSDGNGRFSTYDSDTLTRLVFLAHDMDVRATLKASTHGYFKLVFSKVSREGFVADNHPTLDEALEKFRRAA